MEVTDMGRSKSVGLIVVLCAVLATPVLGTWRLTGTTVHVSEPESAWHPNGKWWYQWNGDGEVSASPTYLSASGWTWGECGAHLDPYWFPGLSTAVYVESSVYGRNSYSWDEDGLSKVIDFVISSTLDIGGVSYEGLAVDDTHVSVASAYSGASGYGGAGLSTLLNYYPQGSGEGYAITLSGSDAYNDWDGVTVSKNETDSGYAEFTYNKWYEGALEFTTSTAVYYTGEPSASTFLVSASVGGNACAVGSITINDSNYQHLYMCADAFYHVDGETEVALDGNIE